MPQQTVVVTGATGFLGRALCARLQLQGYHVRAMARQSTPPEGLTRAGISRLYLCDLPDRIDESAFQGRIRSLVHCAFETRFANVEAARRTNILGTRAILRLAREHGVQQFVFISSLSADPAVQSTYGQTKREAEGMLDPDRDLAIRPGLILGDSGLFGRMRKLVCRLPIIPIFYGGKQIVQTVWIEDLCTAILTAIERGLTGTLKVAEPDGLTLQQLYRELCRLEHQRRILMPFPGQLTYWILRGAEKLGVSPPISSDNLLGLKALAHNEVSGDLQRLGMTVGSFRESAAKLSASMRGGA